MHVEGRSMCGLFGGGSTDWRTHMMGEYNTHTPCHFYPRRAIRDDRYKLILNLMPDRTNPVHGPGAAPAVAGKDRYEGAPVRETYQTYQNPPRVELYDLKKDPHEFENLAGRPEHATIEKRLKETLAARRRETDDPYLDADRMEKDRKRSARACREVRRRRK
jgi:N-sulfoglucosamine sulfohydrolase